MLKYQVESLDGIEEPLHAFYEQGDKGYTLKVDGVVPKSRFDEVNQTAIDNATEAQRRRKTVERVTGKLGIEDASKLDEALDALMSGKGKGKDDQEAVVAQIRQEYEGKLSEAQKQMRDMKMGAARAGLVEALNGVKFHPEIISDIAATAMARVQIDDDGNLRIMSQDGKPLAGSGRDGYATFADLAKELAAAKPSFLLDGGKGGGGKPPASGGASAAKTVPRSQFDAMSQYDRVQFAKSGGKVVDG